MGVDVVAADLLGRPVGEVQAELESRGLRVELAGVETAEAGAGLVTAVDPAGLLPPDALVRVAYRRRPRAGAHLGAGPRTGPRPPHRWTRRTSPTRTRTAATATPRERPRERKRPGDDD